MTFNFYLGKPNINGRSSIYLRFNYPQGVLNFSTRNKVLAKDWNNKKQRVKVKSTNPNHKELNIFLNSVENEVYNIYNKIVNENICPTNNNIRTELKGFLNLTTAKKEITHELIEYDFFNLFTIFIEDSISGKRLQKNGKQITKQTIEQYQYVFKYLKDFSAHSNFKLKIHSIINRSAVELNNIKEYYKNFYHRYTEYLYTEKHYFDNTVGSNIKVIRSFFNYLINGKGLNIGDFHRNFYVRQEEIPVLVIEPEQLNYLIKDSTLNNSLTSKERRAKDYFILGSTFALRLSDLKKISKSNIVIENNQSYLSVISKKSGKSTKVHIPDYCLEIFDRYKDKYETLLPPTNSNELNLLLRQVGKKCKWDKPIIKTRERRGQKITIYKEESKKEHFLLSDLITMHCARRTAITTLLRLGVAEYIVKTISGHSQNSASFQKYVALADSHKNKEFSNAIDKLMNI